MLKTNSKNSVKKNVFLLVWTFLLVGALSSNLGLIKGAKTQFSRTVTLHETLDRVSGKTIRLIQEEEETQGTSSSSFLRFTPSRVGDSLDITIPPIFSGRYLIEIQAKTEIGGGSVQVRLNGVDIGETVSFSGQPSRDVPVSLGVGLHRVKRDGEQTFSLTSVDGLPIQIHSVRFRHRPNILLIYTDDHSRVDVAAYGFNVLTPGIDRLAAEGVLFERGYVTSSICTPSRFTLLTGRSPTRSQSLQLLNPVHREPTVQFNTHLIGKSGVMEFETLPFLMQGAGYVTGMVGKWHTGGSDPSISSQKRRAQPGSKIWKVIEEQLKGDHAKFKKWARECGFTETPFIVHGNVENDSRPRYLEKHAQEHITYYTNQFLEQHQNDPFFFVVAPTLVHVPFPYLSLNASNTIHPYGVYDKPEDQALYNDIMSSQPSRQSVIERVEEGKKDMRSYGATWLDDGVTSTLEKVEELGLADDTLVFLISDNGVNNAKGHTYEWGSRIPFMARWPGKISPGRVSRDLVMNLDIAPTLYEICDIPLPVDHTLDGQSIVDALVNERDYSRDNLLLEVGSSRAVVTDDGLKYIALRFNNQIMEDMRVNKTRYNHGGKKEHGGPHYIRMAYDHYPDYWDHDQLYDLKRDPNEQKNLYNDPFYKVKRDTLRTLLQKYSAGLPHTFGEFKTTPS